MVKENKKKILLVDYYGMCNENGQPVGHSAKVLNEYGKLLQEKFHLDCALSPCLVDNVDKNIFHDVYTLPYDIHIQDSLSLLGRIHDKRKLFVNIKTAMNKANRSYDAVWFYRTDIFLFLFMGLGWIPNKTRSVVLVYQNKFGSGLVSKILQCLYQKGLDKFDGVIYTQKGADIHHKRLFYMPDYYYTNKYDNYITDNKLDQVACVGTMNKDKELEKLVHIFNQNGYPLLIKGVFFDKEQYEGLTNVKNENIGIEDRRLSEDEYYNLIARSKYVILPYLQTGYDERTSGVLQECCFLNTTVIAPRFLLEQNHMNGIGYNDLSELTNWAKLMNSQETFNFEYDKKIYQFENIQISLSSFISKVMG